MYQDGLEEKDLAALKKRIKSNLCQFDIKENKRITRLKTKVRQVADYGPDSEISHAFKRFKQLFKRKYPVFWLTYP